MNTKKSNNSLEVTTKKISKTKNSSSLKGKRPSFIVVNGVDNWHEILFPAQIHYVVSVDPGTENFALRIEERVRINDYYCNVNTVVMERTSFENVYGKYSNSLITSITNFLDKYWNYYSNVSLFLIEDQQVTESHIVANVFQHVVSYFYIYTKLCPGAIVALVDSKAKTRYLNAPKMKRPERVKWQAREGLRFLHLRNDIYGLSKYQEYKDKADDMMVTLIQVEAIYRHLGLPRTPEKK